jgi:hypothetical protein
MDTEDVDSDVKDIDDNEKKDIMDTEDADEMDMDIIYSGNTKDTEIYNYIYRLDRPDTKNMSHIYLNADGARFDVFEFFEYDANDKKLCLTQQVKITSIEANESMTIDQKLFDEECKKVALLHLYRV